ncbi:vacuolar protein sorting-associated protein 32 homolog 2-like [Spinacia oleracea]|uniref:Vacuolar protein sorting-associated protein 32 homolog 2-like n=1 Tax=Spinacia oleracea TaxID=3562 RepID=A0ABM3QJP1_SPIOL|nr:vacuolar protein sorting-associated protein 32 homolog 2-like [Spinacia oleracea]
MWYLIQYCKEPFVASWFDSLGGFIGVRASIRNIDDVDQTMDEINKQTYNLRQIREALASHIGGAADFDEDELEAELEELEGAELEEQLLQPAITAPIAPIKAIRT